MKDRFKELLSVWPVLLTLVGVIAMWARLEARVEEIVKIVDANQSKLIIVADRQTDVRLTLTFVTNDMAQIKERVHALQGQISSIKKSKEP